MAEWRHLKRYQNYRHSATPMMGRAGMSEHLRRQYFAKPRRIASRRLLISFHPTDASWSATYATFARQATRAPTFSAFKTMPAL